MQNFTDERERAAWPETGIMNIVLIGYRGAGKSTVGRLLAEALRRKFVDTDEVLARRERSSILDIVENFGWPRFRTLEREIIREAAREDNLVIAPGGGAVLDGGNVSCLKRNGLVIWLRAEARVLGKRLERSRRTAAARPALTPKGVLEELEEVLTAREPFYAQAADLQIETSRSTKKEVLESILSALHENAERI